MDYLTAILTQPTLTHDLVQGTPPWDAFRLAHRGASEAAAVLGLSKNLMRNDLLKAKHSGIAREFSAFVQERVLDKGHELEALARPIIEDRIAEDLYPATCSRGMLSASCDGITLDNSFVLEHKQWNEELAASVRAGVLPDEHMPQCQQIMLVTGAQEVEFVVSDGTAEKMVSMLVTPDRAWWERIVAGWVQFDADLAAYVPPEVVQPVTAAPIEQLPSVSVRVDGALAVITNLDVFGAKLREFVGRIPAKPTTDQEFADCDAACKALKTAEETIKAARSSAIGQVTSIEELTRALDTLSDVARTARLASEKMVKARKDEIKTEQVHRGIAELAKHIESLNERLGRPYMPKLPAQFSDFAGAIANLRNFDSLRNAIDTKLAAAKIEASRIADIIEKNLNWLREHAEEFKFLFADVATLALKDFDDMKAVAENRINGHKAEQQAKADAERERIRKEEADRADREARTRLAAEQEEAARAQKAAETPVPPLTTHTDAPVYLPLTAANERRSAPSVVPIAPAPRAAPTSPPTLTLGAISERLGFAITADFARRMGFEGTKVRSATLFHEADMPQLIDGIVMHLRKVQHELQKAA